VCVSWPTALPKLLAALVVFAPFLPLPTSFLGEYPGAPAARLHTYGTYLIALFSCEGLFSARENAPFEKMRFGWPKT